MTFLFFYHKKMVLKYLHLTYKWSIKLFLALKDKSKNSFCDKLLILISKDQ